MNPHRQNRFVDSHFHIFPALQKIAGARYVPAYSARLEDWMGAAAAHGVSRGVLVQPSFLGTDNSFMLSALNVYPAALRGVAVVPANTRLAQLKGLHQSGVRGIRLNLAGRSHEIDEWTRAGPLWSALLELGWHLELHTDQGGLPAVLAQLPEQLPLVIDHMGKPEGIQPSAATFRAVIQRAAQAPVHIKLSGAYRLNGLDPLSVARIWLAEIGVESLLWGSDWPCTNHESLADYGALFSSLEQWVGAEDLVHILALNPRKLYWGEMT